MAISCAHREGSPVCMTIIKTIREQAEKKQLDFSQAFGRAWLLQKMAKLNPTPLERGQILKDQEAQRSRIIIGRFYYFLYNPKGKDTLPYWDKFPLVIPLQRYHDGFLGLNLHYIYPKDRLILLQQLKRTMSTPLMDERTRLRLSYPILKAMHQAYRATPCIKRYLAGHILSRFIEIPPNEWDIALTLPVQDFRAQMAKTSSEALTEEQRIRKARQSHVRKEQVWKDSKEKY